MKIVFTNILISAVALCMVLPAFGQERTLERVTTPGSVPGWGVPLIGEREAVDYYIAPGDEILISAWKNPDLTRRVTVKGDGDISYPLIGTIPAAGLTVDQLRENLKKAISPYS